MSKRSTVDPGRFYARVIVTDIPAPYALWSKKGAGRSAEAHYDTQDWSWLKRMGAMVNAIAHPEGCALMNWLFPPNLHNQIEVFKSWAANDTNAPFWDYKTINAVWVKLERSAMTMKMGMGKTGSRANVELLDIWTHGTQERLDLGVRQVVPTTVEFLRSLDDLIAALEMMGHESPAYLARSYDHSEKPEAIYEAIERLLPGPYVSLFDRQPRPGWICLGEEITGNDIRADLTALAEGRFPLPETKQRRIPRKKYMATIANGQTTFE